MRSRRALVVAMCLVAVGGVLAAWTPVPVKDDPLVRMPGTQPEQGVNLEAPNRCLNCHAGYNEAVEPGFNWAGSMMAQAARDPIFWACLTVAAQDSVWAIGTPNATDLCLRCHFPEGWLAGRSDPTNATAMTGSDYDGVHCDFCHRMVDPFFEATYAGTRESTDWDETSTLSLNEADKTRLADQAEAAGVKLFNGGDFFENHVPWSSEYKENASGQYFVSAGSEKRASFADAAARHQMLYSRYHKSKYFCATCHDVSNPVLANLGADPALPLPTESVSAASYFHVERTFSEFMLSAYGRGGAATNPEFRAQGAPSVTWADKCQDCHMRDVVGQGCNKNGVPIRPSGSTEHPKSGQPLHDLTGGNVWISYILGTLSPASPNYDPVNEAILGKGPEVLTLDLSAGQSPLANSDALMAGSARAAQQLRLAATFTNVTYNASTGALSFRVQNNTGHKLISGFPEGRRMFVNIQARAQGQLIFEVNPYAMTVGTLKGLPKSASSPPLGPTEAYVDELVYEVHPSSTLTNEEETFHFVLATGRYKDNRIPPKGFQSSSAAERLCLPVWHGESAPDYFTSQEYAGGYDEVAIAIPPGADHVVLSLYYQGTSREYIEFLRDEINGNANTLSPKNGQSAYIIQTDPFFSRLKAWGNTIWDLWVHNHGLDGSGVRVAGIVPFEMTRVEIGGTTQPVPVPTLLTAVPGNGQVALTWSDEHANDPAVVGYSVYYDQEGKAQFIAEVEQTTTYTDTGLTNGQQYSYKVTARYADRESDFSNVLSAIPNNQGQARVAVASLEAGRYETVGKGKNKEITFVPGGTFAAGEAIVLRAHVIDRDTGLPLAGATVDIGISGPEGVTVIAGPSDADGIADGTWQTTAPNRKGRGGTALGSYTASVANVTADGYTWDKVVETAAFTIE